MSFTALGANARSKREKCFGLGRTRPLDREAKVRVMVRAEGLMRRTEAGKAYGVVTAKALAVLKALLWGFHNAKSGVCYPSFEKIAERAGCARSTVAKAIKALEAAGVLTWVNRIVRVRVRCRDLFGKEGTRIRVLRTSNAYRFSDPGEGGKLPEASKSDFRPGTLIQESSLVLSRSSNDESLQPELTKSLNRYRKLAGFMNREGLKT